MPHVTEQCIEIMYRDSVSIQEELGANLWENLQKQ